MKKLYLVFQSTNFGQPALQRIFDTREQAEVYSAFLRAESMRGPVVLNRTYYVEEWNLHTEQKRGGVV